ncbi:MAG TPA: iron-containing alcohol dehydrogenase [Prolixibacteraceae bacterium]|nr:iron-containing alcohol dehydrogenase [Prolixibacteraceae bacterium]
MFPRFSPVKRSTRIHDLHTTDTVFFDDNLLQEKRNIVFYQPRKLVFGAGCSTRFVDDFAWEGIGNLFVLTIPPLLKQVEKLVDELAKKGISGQICCDISAEPSFADVEKIRMQAHAFGARAIAGIGGGSVLDTAKILAAMLNSDMQIREVVGINQLINRSIYLACLPTTSGTGSEVSPNAIFLDEKDGGKKAIISPYLVPDASYIDPELTLGLPPGVTASTAIDAFTHCLEAYINNFAHPITDRYALEGMRLIYHNLPRALREPGNTEARTALALGSLYGGMCLGPVNTGAIHALSYPLGSRFKIPHGVSNALLLPYVAEFNRPYAVDRFAQVGETLGLAGTDHAEDKAKKAVSLMRNMVADAGLPMKLSDLGISADALPAMAEEALTVQRLLKNNVRNVRYPDAVALYNKAF